MHIIVGNTPNIIKDPEKRPPFYDDKEKRKNRRKNKQDRRKGNRDGVIVTISDPNDRRKHPDRRQK